MLIKTIFAGFGGQGVLSMGMILAYAGMIEDKNVTYLPAYGAEMRGGTANCTVAVSDEEIASPVASSPDFIVVMNQPSLARFQNHVQPGGQLFVNTSLVEVNISRGDIDVVEVPATEMAEKLGNPRSANVVMLGAFIKRTNLVSVPNITEGVRNALKNKKKLIPLNEKALMTGYDFL